MKDLLILMFCTGNTYFFYVTFIGLYIILHWNLLIYITSTLITYSVKYSFSGLNWYLLPLLKKLFWYFCLVIREFKKRLRDTQLTCKTKEKRAVFWLLLFFLKELYMFMHTSISGSCYHHLMLDIAAFPSGYELESNSVACYFVKTRQHHL